MKSNQELAEEKKYIWYYLDGDNRKWKDEHWVCQRCFKRLNESKVGESFKGIILHTEFPWFRMAAILEKADGFIGSDCLKYVIKEYGEMKIIENSYK